jgi:Tfp pilus assembly protein PilO
MNKNTTALILIILAIGIYFTFTRMKIDELKSIRAVNAEYQKAIDNSAQLLKVRDDVLKAYNSISESDKEHLNKIVPDYVDNVRLIIDVKDDIAARHGLFLRNIRTSSPDIPTSQTVASSQGVKAPTTDTSRTAPGGEKYGVVTLSFSVTTTYEQFVDFLKDLESSLRILDISKLTLAGNDSGTFDFTVELKTYWIK